MRFTCGSEKHERVKAAVHVSRRYYLDWRANLRNKRLFTVEVAGRHRDLTKKFRVELRLLTSVTNRSLVTTIFALNTVTVSNQDLVIYA